LGKSADEEADDVTANTGAGVPPGSGGSGGNTLLRRSRAGEAAAGVPGTAPHAAAGERPEDHPVSWLLRELRPVSFHLKRGPEAKYLKFGFVAQELEGVFPNLVRTVGKEETKAVASQDLIAVLTLALQTLQAELQDARAWMAREMQEQRRFMDQEVQAQRLRMERLERVLLAVPV
jgi:hypothetical protein